MELGLGTGPAFQYARESATLLAGLRAHRYFRRLPASERTCGSWSLRQSLGRNAQRGNRFIPKSNLRHFLLVATGRASATAIHLASLNRLTARRANRIDAWKPLVTKIRLATTIERLDPCFIAYLEATTELKRRFPVGKFVWTPLAANTNIFYRAKRKSRTSPSIRAGATSLCIRRSSNIAKRARPQVSLFRQVFVWRGTRPGDVQRLAGC